MLQETLIRRYGQAAIAEAAALILAGQLVAIPTETVYGLVADATNSEAVAQIYAAKGRPSFNPLIIHVADLAAAERLAVFDASARRLAMRYWPGPLTLVLPAHPDSLVATIATAELATVAVRVPAHRAMQALLVATGLPLAAPSANASGTISPTRPAHVEHTLAGRIAMILDDGPCAIGIESTIIAAIDGSVRLLRAGPLVIETMGDQHGSEYRPGGARTIEAPGQLLSHYAPTKPVRLNAYEAAPDEWLIGFGAISGHASLSRRGDLIEAAAALFDLLHQADASSAARIAVAPIPATGVGHAIIDRLTRAAH